MVRVFLPLDGSIGIVRPVPSDASIANRNRRRADRFVGKGRRGVQGPRVRTVSHREAEVTMDAAKPMVRAKAWVGVDVGKEFHWAVVVDAEGEILLSRRVENEEADVSALVEEVLAVSGGEPCWAVDQPGGGAALLL